MNIEWNHDEKACRIWWGKTSTKMVLSKDVFEDYFNSDVENAYHVTRKWFGDNLIARPSIIDNTSLEYTLENIKKGYRYWRYTSFSFGYMKGSYTGYCHVSERGDTRIYEFADGKRFTETIHRCKLGGIKECVRCGYCYHIEFDELINKEEEVWCED